MLTFLLKFRNISFSSSWITIRLNCLFPFTLSFSESTVLASNFEAIDSTQSWLSCLGNSPHLHESPLLSTQVRNPFWSILIHFDPFWTDLTQIWSKKSWSNYLTFYTAWNYFCMKSWKRRQHQLNPFQMLCYPPSWNSSKNFQSTIKP